MITFEELQKEIQVEKQRIEELEKSLNKLQGVTKQSKYPMELVFIGSWHSMSGLMDDGEIVRKHYMFAQLVETCKAWNKVDGFEPDLNNNTQKYQVENKNNKLSITDYLHFSSPIHFKTRETAQLFIDTFKETLEQVKDLI